MPDAVSQGRFVTIYLGAAQHVYAWVRHVDRTGNKTGWVASTPTDVVTGKVNDIEPNSINEVAYNSTLADTSTFGTTSTSVQSVNIAAQFDAPVFVRLDASFRNTSGSTKTFDVLFKRGFDGATVSTIANPNAKLYLCDYAQERYPAKRDAFLTLAQDLKARGTVDGLNFQSHLFSDVNYDYTAVRQMFADAAGLGLEVGISEFDIRNGSLVLTATQKKLLAQEMTYQYFSAALKGAGAALKDVLFWGMADTQSWTNGSPPYNNTTQYPLPFDSSYGPNPMLEGFKAAFFNS